MSTYLLSCVIPVVLSALFALYIGPILIRAALRYGIVDRPTTTLKQHQEPVPYLGGLVVFVSFLLTLALTFPFERQVLAILLATSLIVAVGLVDDLGTLSPKDKLIGQMIAAVILIKAGVRIELVAMPTPIDEVVSVFWLLTCINAFNILDVSDGLATSAGIVGCVGAMGIAVLNGEPTVVALTAALLGALLGFLRFNRQPARMYLGDTGSMLIGMLLGALAMIGRYSELNHVSAFFVPLTLVAMPLFDLGLVIIARVLARRPIYHGSPDHFAVRLRHHGRSPRFIARLASLAGVLVVGVGVGSVFLDDFAAACVATATMAAGVTLWGVFLIRFPPRLPPTAATVQAPLPESTS